MRFDLLCLDAGGTVVFLDHDRVAKIVGISPEILARAEGVMKQKLETGHVEVEWSGSHLPGFAMWGRGMATMLDDAGIDRSRIPALLDALRQAHLDFNLWSKVPEGLRESVLALRKTGVKVVIVSNSEGSLEKLFDRLGILDAFDFVLDSAIVGIEKPDPGIFRIALDRTGIPADRALHVGDVYAMDVVGARAAGVHPALIDPAGHYSGRHDDVPRVESVKELAESLVVVPGPTYLQLTTKKVQS